MIYTFGPHEVTFAQWCRGGCPNIPEGGRQFIKNLDSPGFSPPLWKHQREAILRSIYAFEILGKKDLLLKIVTGGGKTIIIGAMIAYLLEAHDVRQHLILVPNTVVRSRLDDAFNPMEKGYVFRVFPFFSGIHHGEGERLSFHVMAPGGAAAGIRSANIVLGNVHQIYERTDNWRVIYENCDKLAIYNDEAHNTKAEQYNDLINKLKPKRVLRLDTTATPDRLDGLHPDSEMIYAYDIREAMRDKVIKRVVVFKPDIEKVKFTYKDTQTGETINAEEMPWEEIEAKKVPAVRYVTHPKPMGQQLSIALECLKYHRKVAGKEYKPLLFVVALNIADAERIQSHIESESLNGQPLKALLITNESDDEKRDEAMKINRNIRECKYDVIVSVQMLREGWDVKNICVILLFRKFSFIKIGERIHSVYGPQIIGRGLRKIKPLSDDWEQCHVVDHPILKHDWLWDEISAVRYAESFNPGDVIDERKIPAPPESVAGEGDDTKSIEQAIFDVSSLPPVPEPPSEVEVITEWQKYLDDVVYDTRAMDIVQTIRQIHSRNLDSGMDTLDGKKVPEIPVSVVREAFEATSEQLVERLSSQVRVLARDALVEYDRNPDGRQEILLQVIHAHLRKRFLKGLDLKDCTDARALADLWETFPQIRDNFLNPALIAGILAQPATVKVYAESSRSTV